jgi:conjugal transfer ATP-binding protein TraC
VSQREDALPSSDVASYTGLLPYHSVDPEGPVVLLTNRSSGDPDWLGMVWAVGIADTEIQPDEGLSVLAGRLEHVLDAVPEETLVQFLVRTQSDVRAELDRWKETTKTDDSLLAKLVDARAQMISSLAIPSGRSTFRARSVRAYFTIARPGTWMAGEISPLEALSTLGPDGDLAERRAHERVRRSYESDRKALLETAATLESLFTQAGIGTRRLGEDELAGVLYGYLNPRRAATRAAWPASGGLLRDRVADSTLSVDLDEGIVTLDGVHHKVVTVVGLPAATIPGILTRPTGDAREPSLLGMAAEMDLALEIYVGSQEELRRGQAARRRLATNQSMNVHQSPAMNPMREELVALEQDLARGIRILSVRLHAIPRASSVEAVSEAARSIATKLANFNLRAIVEDVLAGSLFLECLPLAYRTDLDAGFRRARTMLAPNAAHLIPLYGGFRGTPRGTQLLVARSGELLPLSMFNGTEVPHAIITGKSGSGKSVFANDLILQALRTGGRVWVLDRGGSYRKLSEMLGGDYVSYDDTPRRINPCGRSPESGNCPEYIQAFLREWLCEMCTQGTSDLSVPQQSLLTSAVRLAYDKNRGREVTITHLHQALLELGKEHPSAKDLALSLMDFQASGAYGKLFDGTGEVNFENRLVAIDLGTLVKKKAVGSVLLMALVQEIVQTAARWPHDEKYLIIDEGWTLLASSATARFLEDVARTARKARLSLVMLSQQLSDFRGPSGQAILEQASTKVLLHHDAEAIRTTAGIMGLSAREVELYLSLRTEGGKYSEVFIRTPFGSGVGRLVVDPLSYWIMTSDPRDKELLERLRARYAERGASDRDSLEQALLEASMSHPAGAGQARAGREK